MRRSLPAVLIALTLLIPGAVGHAQDATPAASPAVCAETTEAENAALARRWHEDAMNNHDLSVLDEILAPATDFDPAGFPEDSGPKQVLGALLAGFPDVHQTVEMVVAQDDLVAIRYSSTGTHTGEFQGIAPTGKTVTWTGMNFYLIECGRIADVWSEVDAMSRLAQITGTPEAATPAP
ncbi:MAG: ester cyclase [Thermomicrobiales bacterium]